MRYYVLGVISGFSLGFITAFIGIIFGYFPI